MINIDSFTQEERKQIVDLVSKSEAANLIKKAHKRFPKELSKEIKGMRVDLKSVPFQKKIPIILIRGWELREIGVTTLIRNTMKDITKRVNEDIKIKTGETDFIKKTILTKDPETYKKLLKLMSEHLESQYFMLFFKISEIELKPRSKKLMETTILEFNHYMQQREMFYKEHQKELEEEYNRLIREKEENYQILLKQERTIGEQLKEKLKYKEQEIKLLQADNKKKEDTLDSKNREYVQLEKKLESINKKVDQSNQKSIKELMKLQEESKQEKQQINKLINKLEIQQKENKYLQEELDKLRMTHYKEFSIEYTAQWKKEQHMLVDDRKAIELEIKEIIDRKEILEDEVIDLEKYKRELELAIEESSLLAKDLQGQIADQKVQMSSIAGAQEDIYIKKGTKEEHIDKSENIGDFSEVLEDNLKNIGTKKMAVKWADYIISALAAKRTPLIIGYETRKIAKAISYAYAGESPLVIALNGGYNNPSKLIDLYHTTESSVILIEGAVGQINESAILPLLKEYLEDEESEKIILLSCEDEDVLKLIPAYLFDYVALIQIEEMTPAINTTYIKQDSKDEIRKIRQSNLEVNKAYKNLKRLFMGTNFTKGYLISRSFILAYLYEIMIEEEAIEYLLQCDLKTIVTYIDERDKIVSNIEQNPIYFNKKLREIIV